MRAKRRVELRRARRAASRPTARRACCGRRTRPCPAVERRAAVERMLEAVTLRPRVRRAAAATPPARRSAVTSSDEAAKPPVQRIVGPSSTQPSRPSSTRPRRPRAASVEPARVEAHADRQRVPRLLPDDGARRASAASRARRRAAPRRAAAAPRRRPGTRARNSSQSRCRQTRTSESSIEPPSRVPFSRTTDVAAELAQPGAATSPAMPAPATPIT